MSKKDFQIHLSELKENAKDTSITPKNYRVWDNEKEQDLRNDLKAFPRFMEKNQIIYDSKDPELKNKIIGGNRRHTTLRWLFENDQNFLNDCQKMYPNVEFRDNFIPISWVFDCGDWTVEEKAESHGFG